jgi:hypothetical protein
VLLILAVIGLGLLVYLAGLPGRIAAGRGHPQAEAVNICGWIGLPTGGFWVAALVWAFWTPRDTRGVDLESLSEQVSRLEEAVTRLENRVPGGRT